MGEDFAPQRGVDPLQVLTVLAVGRPASASLLGVIGSKSGGREIQALSRKDTLALGRRTAFTADNQRDWIEVWHGSELTAEWHQTKDAELWGWLDKVLRDDPSLYGAPTPANPSPGRGPVLQQARG